LCKNFNQKINLILTKDKIPYEGYYMNCAKIKKTGFKFNNKYKDFVRKFLKKN
tara:strand:- start:1185 stop:1343 length:159 start_codon:yes stop_codon:yes gene_type:complete